MIPGRAKRFDYFQACDWSVVTFPLLLLVENVKSIIPYSRSPNEFTRTNWLDKFLIKLANFSTHRAIKVIVTILTLGFFGLACYGISKLEQRFEERWLIPDDSYLAKWFDDRMEYFNGKGERGTIYVAEFVMSSEQLDRVRWLVKNLANQTDIITEIDTWALGFSDFYDDSMNSSLIKMKLGDYLYSPDGLQFRDRQCWRPGQKIRVKIKDTLLLVPLVEISFLGSRH